MLDANYVRDNLETVKANCRNRNATNADPDAVVRLDGERKKLQRETDETKAKQNEISKKFPQAKSPEEKAALKADSTALKDRVPVPKYEHVVELCAEQPAYHSRKDHVTHGVWINAAPREFSLRHSLAHEEAEQDRDAEASEANEPEVVAERMMDDGMWQQRHALMRPGMGRDANALRSSGARSPRSR